MKGIETVVANLANRINQAHYLEIELRKVFNTGFTCGKKDKVNLVEFLNYAAPLLNNGHKLGEIADGFIKVSEFKESILSPVETA